MAHRLHSDLRRSRDDFYRSIKFSFHFGSWSAHRSRFHFHRKSLSADFGVQHWCHYNCSSCGLCGFTRRPTQYPANSSRSFVLQCNGHIAFLPHSFHAFAYSHGQVHGWRHCQISMVRYFVSCRFVSSFARHCLGSLYCWRCHTQMCWLSVLDISHCDHYHQHFTKVLPVLFANYHAKLELVAGIL